MAAPLAAAAGAGAPARMSELIPDIAALHGLKKINDISIAEIEARARPKSGLPGSSDTGFLAEGESFIGRLVEDWTTLGSLGITPLELGTELENILLGTSKAVWPEGYLGPAERGSFKCVDEDTFDYEYAGGGLKRLLDAAGVAAKVTLTASVRLYGGHQEDLFRFRDPKEPNPFLARTILPEERQWCRDYTLTNAATGESVTVPYGLIYYIKRLGFFEGKVPYRMDPIQLISVMTGIKKETLSTLKK